ncbi:MAG: tetratricopeptide repeat protein [Thermoanaerobaculia bacterium]
MQSARTRAALLILGLCVAGCREKTPALLPLPSDAFAGVGERALELLRPATERLDELTQRGSASRADLAVAWSDLAKLAHAFEIYTVAEPAYRNAALLAPDDGRWPYLEGQMDLAAGDPAAALDAFSRALAAGNESTAVRVGHARALHLLARNDESLAEVGRAIAEAPDDPGALLAGAQIAADLDRPDLAIERYERLRRLQPEATKILSALSLLYRRVGRDPEAEATLAAAGTGTVQVEDALLYEVQSLAPTAAQLAEAGRQAFQSNDLDTAGRLLRQAALAAPESVDNQLNLVALCLRTGQLEEARVAIHRALELAPDLSRAWFAAGVVRSRLGDLSGAVAAYREALRLDSTDASSRQNLANALLRSGETDAARSEYRRILGQDPANAAARVGLAAAELAAGRAVAARKELERDFDPRTTSPQVGGALARILASAPSAEARDGGKALAMIRDRPDLESNAILLETWAMALAETGDFAQAITVQQRALAATGGRNDPATRELAARLQSNLERYRRGEACRDPALF